MSTSDVLEPEGVAEIKGWFAETSRKAYAVGPLFPMDEKATAGDKIQSDKSSEIDQFLERTLEAHGPKSLLYVSIYQFRLAAYSLHIYMLMSKW